MVESATGAYADRRWNMLLVPALPWEKVLVIGDAMEENDLQSGTILFVHEPWRHI